MRAAEKSAVAPCSSPAPCTDVRQKRTVNDDSYFIYAFVVDAFLKIENSQNWQRKNLARVKKYPYCLATLCMAVLLRKFDAHVCVFTVCDRQNLKT